MTLRFDIYEDSAGECRWRAIASNGEIVADSAEGYSDRRACMRALDDVLHAIRMPVVWAPVRRDGVVMGYKPL